MILNLNLPQELIESVLLKYSRLPEMSQISVNGTLFKQRITLLKYEGQGEVKKSTLILRFGRLMAGMSCSNIQFYALAQHLGHYWTYQFPSGHYYSFTTPLLPEDPRIEFVEQSALKQEDNAAKLKRLASRKRYAKKQGWTEQIEAIEKLQPKVKLRRKNGFGY